MAKLFNNIRKKLVTDKPSVSRTSNYLKYAIGEIVLVVIGILIALQLNNLNDIRKTEQEELQSLNDIKLNLMESQLEIKEKLQSDSIETKNYKTLLEHMEQDLPYEASLDSIFANIPAFYNPQLTYSAYESLKAKGIDLIQNDSLKKQIVKIFETDFALLVNDAVRWEYQINQEITMPFFTDHIRRNVDNLNLATPNDYEALKKNEKFGNLLSQLIFNRYWDTLISKKIEVGIDSLISNIEKELNNRGYKNKSGD